MGGSAEMGPRYWGEAFMYAVHIRSLSPTSALNNIVPFHAWYGRKPDMSHLHIFGSVGYVNIPKKTRKGKLAVTSFKCRIIGWWADETKGYGLEDVVTGKLITARDVKFIEDDSPGDLAIIETRGKAPTKEELNALVPTDLRSQVNPPLEPATSTPVPEPQQPVEAVDDNPLPPTHDSTPVPTTNFEPQAPKPSKWANFHLETT